MPYPRDSAMTLTALAKTELVEVNPVRSLAADVHRQRLGGGADVRPARAGARVLDLVERRVGRPPRSRRCSSDVSGCLTVRFPQF